MYSESHGEIGLRSGCSVGATREVALPGGHARLLAMALLWGDRGVGSRILLGCVLCDAVAHTHETHRSESRQDRSGSDGRSFRISTVKVLFVPQGGYVVCRYFLRALSFFSVVPDAKTSTGASLSRACTTYSTTTPSTTAPSAAQAFMALATPHVIVGGQQWSLQRKAAVSFDRESVGEPKARHAARGQSRPTRPTSAFMQRELDNLVFKRGGYVYTATSPDARLQREREAWLAQPSPLPQGWPAAAATSPVKRPKPRPASAAWAAGYTSTVNAQKTGALDGSTGLSTPNWFSQVGPHEDDYGESYYFGRRPSSGGPILPSQRPSVADVMSQAVPPPLQLEAPPPPQTLRERPPPRTLNTPPSPGQSQFLPGDRLREPSPRRTAAARDSTRDSARDDSAADSAATATATDRPQSAELAAASNFRGQQHASPGPRSRRAPRVHTPPSPPATLQPRGLLFKLTSGSPNPSHRKHANPFYPSDWTASGGSYGASYAANYTANYGESRRKQAPLQIKIADRFDRPEIHERLGQGTLGPAVPVPTIDMRTGLKGHVSTYPWAP